MANETVNTLVLRVELKGTVTGLDGAKLEINRTYEHVFTDGTGSDQVTQVWVDQVRTLAATNEDADLNGSSSYKDFQGTALAMTGLRLIMVENLDTDTGDYLEVARPASNGVTGVFKAASDAVIVQPGGLFLWVAPGVDKGTVTAATGDLLNLLAADTSTFYVALAGTE